MITLTGYIQANKQTIVRNWNDPFIREKYKDDVNNYIKSKCERMERAVYKQWIEADVSIKSAQNKLTDYLKNNL